MNLEERNNLKVDDVLLCVRSDWCFEKGQFYKVYKASQESSDLVIWCDDIQPHWTKSLDLTTFEVVDQRAFLRQFLLTKSIEDNREALEKMED